ncbi:MAG TPA: DnaB-like helicase N-terminal domain-containing protein [Polyangia bacterium]|jgi:replicative DNA helicase
MTAAAVQMRDGPRTPSAADAARTRAACQTAKSDETSVSQQIPPHNPYAERMVNGAILLRPSVIAPVIARGLAPEHFYLPLCRVVYGGIVALHQRGVPVDVISVADEVRQSSCGREQLRDLEQHLAAWAQRGEEILWNLDIEDHLDDWRRRAATAEDIGHWVAIIQRDAGRRQQIADHVAALTRLYDGLEVRP